MLRCIFSLHPGASSNRRVEEGKGRAKGGGRKRGRSSRGAAPFCFIFSPFLPCGGSGSAAFHKKEKRVDHEGKGKKKRGGSGNNLTHPSSSKERKRKILREGKKEKENPFLLRPVPASAPTGEEKRKKGRKGGSHRGRGGRFMTFFPKFRRQGRKKGGHLEERAVFPPFFLFLFCEDAGFPLFLPTGKGELKGRRRR